MLWGLSFAVISVATGLALLALTIVLLIWGRNQPPIALPLWKLGEVKGPAWFGVLILGVALLWVPMWRSYERPERLPISGRITLPAGRTRGYVVVSVVPSSHTTLTLADGTYSLRIPKGEEGMQYQGLVYVPNTNPPEYYLGVVRFDADGRGTFDYTVGKR